MYGEYRVFGLKTFCLGCKTLAGSMSRTLYTSDRERAPGSTADGESTRTRDVIVFPPSTHHFYQRRGSRPRLRSAVRSEPMAHRPYLRIARDYPLPAIAPNVKNVL